MGKHSIPEPPPRVRRVWCGGELVELPLPGKYVHPATGINYTLMGAMGAYVTQGGGSTGWPTFWRDLVPAS